MSAVTEPLLDSASRLVLEDLINRAAVAADEEAERAAREAEEQQAVIQRLCDGVAKMVRRMDALEQSRRDRHRLDELSEQTEEAFQLPVGVIDPDAAEVPGVVPR
jgi:hypothetical protein